MRPPHPGPGNGPPPPSRYHAPPIAGTRIVILPHQSSHCLSYRNALADLTGQWARDVGEREPTGWPLSRIVFLAPVMCASPADAEWVKHAAAILGDQQTVFVQLWLPVRQFSVTSTMCPFGCYRALIRCRSFTAAGHAGAARYYNHTAPQCVTCRDRKWDSTSSETELRWLLRFNFPEPSDPSQPDDRWAETVAHCLGFFCPSRRPLLLQQLESVEKRCRSKCSALFEPGPHGHVLWDQLCAWPSIFRLVLGWPDETTCRALVEVCGREVATWVVVQFTSVTGPIMEARDAAVEHAMKHLAESAPAEYAAVRAATTWSGASSPDDHRDAEAAIAELLQAALQEEGEGVA